MFAAVVGTQMLSAFFCRHWDKWIISQPCQRNRFCPWLAQCDELTPRNKPQRRQRVRARLAFCSDLKGNMLMLLSDELIKRDKENLP